MRYEQVDFWNTPDFKKLEQKRDQSPPQRWHGHDHFGNRADGEEAAREATPEEWRILWYMAWEWFITNHTRPLLMTSQDVTDLIGLPQEFGGHPSHVGANTTPTARLFGLVSKGTEKARGRHQQWNTVWGLADE